MFIIFCCVCTKVNIIFSGIIIDIGKMRDYDRLLRRIGEFGLYQKIFYVVLIFTGIPNAIQSMLNTYLQATPKFWCSQWTVTNASQGSFHRRAPPGEYGNATAECFRQEPFLNGNQSEQSDVAYEKCSSWDYDYTLYGNTAVTQVRMMINYVTEVEI